MRVKAPLLVLMALWGRSGVGARRPLPFLASVSWGGGTFCMRLFGADMQPRANRVKKKKKCVLHMEESARSVHVWDLQQHEQL